MSITNLLNQNTPSQNWVDLRVNTITVDKLLNLSQTAHNVLSLDIVPFSILSTSQAFNSVNLIDTNNSNIVPQGITYSEDIINVSVSGYYLVNVQFRFALNSWLSSANNEYVDIILWNKTSSFGIIASNTLINSEIYFTGGFTRVVNLIANNDYQILINQSIAQQLDFSGNQNSYISIIKLF